MRKYACYILIVLAVSLMYPLSLGPVAGCCTTVTFRSPTVFTVTYPHWASIAYYPLFMLDGNGPYWRYVNWWIKKT